MLPPTTTTLPSRRTVSTCKPLLVYLRFVLQRVKGSAIRVVKLSDDSMLTPLRELIDFKRGRDPTSSEAIIHFCYGFRLAK